jgi:hypothetical protein
MPSNNALPATIEHVNISVSDPDKIAQNLCQLFDWTVRWSGASMDNGYTVHVGSENSYFALYRANTMDVNKQHNHRTLNNLNHIGIVVNDLTAYANRARKLGLEPFNYSDYGPCRSFYLKDEFDLEIEIISYD